MTILELYEKGKNIMQISKQLKIKPSVIISALVKGNVIEKRGQARGYKDYIATPAYASAVKSFEKAKANAPVKVTLEARVSKLEKLVATLQEKLNE